MDDITLKNEIAKRIGATRILWFALVSSVFVYAGLGYYLQNMAGFQTPPDEMPVEMAWAIMFMGISAAVVGVLIASGAIRFPKVRGDSIDDRYRSAQTGLLISWALCESAAASGLVIFFLFRSFSDLLLMVAVSAAGLIVSFPSESRMLTRISDRTP